MLTHIILFLSDSDYSSSCVRSVAVSASGVGSAPLVEVDSSVAALDSALAAGVTGVASSEETEPVASGVASDVASGVAPGRLSSIALAPTPSGGIFLEP